MSDRQTKVAALIKELTATFIRQEANTDPMITVTRVDISPDLKRAIIFFTTIPDGKEGPALIFMKRSGSELRKYIMKKMNIKHIPHFDFMVDAGERHRQHMDEVIQDINKDKPVK